MRKALLIVSVAVFGLSFGGGEQAVSTFTDTRDGKVYRIVKIGSQTWFAENLNFAAKGSKCYDNKADSCAKYGRLYNWKTALTVCPAGFHLPDDNEWYTLRDYADSQETAGTRLKSTGGWNNNGNGTDDYGFSALPGGGCRYGDFGSLGYNGLWWSATGYDDYRAWIRYISNRKESERRISSRTNQYSVRCVAD